MADYKNKPTGNIRKSGTDPKLLTTGMADTVSSVESRELKQNDSRKALQNLKRGYKKQGAHLTVRVANAIGRMVGRFGTPVSDLLFNPKSGNYGEKEMLGALKEQEKASGSARNKMVGPAHFQATLLNEKIQNKNAIQDIVNFSGTGNSFHVDHYDVLFGQDGIMFKDPKDLTEEEKRYGLGYTQSVSHLLNVKKNNHQIANDLIKYNKNFVTWINYEGPTQVTDSVEVNGYTKTFPKIVHHGTRGDVSTTIGFWNRHMGSDPDVLARLSGIDLEQEMAGHFGTVEQAQDILKGKHRKETRSGDKYYSGFIKANNLLVLPELYHWEFDSVLEHLQGGVDVDGNLFGGEDADGQKFFQKDEGDNWTYDKPDALSQDREIKLGANPIFHEKIPEFKNDGTNFPRLMEYIGKGTAVEQIMNYAYEMLEKDYTREGIELPDWNRGFESMLPKEKAEIHFYKMHGLIKFINDDLNYDGIEYDNKVEDVEDTDITEPSYILFHPWQFKSIYNHGEFSRYRRNFLGSNSKYKKKEQVA
jgi:hypothetical protein